MALVFKAGERQVSLGANRRKQVLDSMTRIGWDYVTPTTAAIFPLWDRLVDAVRRNRPLTLLQWTRGISVCVRSQRFKTDHVFLPLSGHDIDRRIALELTTFMTARSYFEHGVQVGQFVIDPRLGRPSDDYFAWAASVGLMTKGFGLDRQQLALCEMSRARSCYAPIPSA